MLAKFEMDGAYNHISSTDYSSVLARTSVHIKKALLAFVAEFAIGSWTNCVKIVERHIHPSRPVIWAYHQVWIQVSKTFNSNILAHTRKR